MDTSIRAMLKDENLVILRSYGDSIDLKSYNCQELGLAKSLAKKGLKVTLLLPCTKKVNLSSIKVDSVNIEYIPISWKIHARYCWFHHLEERLNNLKPTILQVHDMDLLMTWRAVRWAKNKKIRCVLIQGPYDKWKKPILRQINEAYNLTFGKYIIRNVSKIGVKSQLASIYLKRYCNCDTFPIKIGLDVERFQTLTSKNWKKELRIEDKTILLYIGSLQPRRNPLFLVDILKELPPKYVLLFAGKGNQEDELKEKIKSHALHERCILLGTIKQEDLPSLYSSSNLFLLASDYEILGMVIMEAMYFGIPVISTRTTGSECLIKNNETGFIMDNKDAVIWADKIDKICQDINRIREMGNKGKRFVMENLTWDKTSEGFMNLYDIV